MYDAFCGVKFKQNFVKLGQMKQAKMFLIFFFVLRISDVQNIIYSTRYLHFYFPTACEHPPVIMKRRL
jgi:hypothetical protein